MRSIILYFTIFAILGLSLLQGQSPLYPDYNQVVFYSLNNEDEPPNNIEVIADTDSFIFQHRGDRNIWKIETDREFKLLESRMEYLEDETIQEAKMKSYHMVRRAPGEYFFTKVNHRNRTKEEELSIEDPKDFNILAMILPYQPFHTGETRFLEFFEPTMMRTFEMSITQKEINSEDIEENYSEYSFPSEMIRNLSSSGKIRLLEGKLEGMAGTFYPYGFYFLINDKNRVLYQWGGKPEEAYFVAAEYKD